MRILIDECIDERLRYSLLGHDCHTARYAGLAGLQNGELLAAAEAAGFDVWIDTEHIRPDDELSLTGRWGLRDPTADHSAAVNPLCDAPPSPPVGP